MTGAACHSSPARVWALTAWIMPSCGHPIVFLAGWLFAWLCACLLFLYVSCGCPIVSLAGCLAVFMSPVSCSNVNFGHSFVSLAVWLFAWLCVCLLFLFVRCGHPVVFFVFAWLCGCLLFLCVSCGHAVVFLAVCLAVCLSPISVCYLWSCYCLLGCLPGCVSVSYICVLSVVTLLSCWLVAWLCFCLQFIVTMLIVVILLLPWLVGCLPGCVSVCYFCLLAVVVLLSSCLLAWLCVCLLFL